MSRRHAIIFREGREWKIDDNSKNGTYVNQERVVGPVVLRDGDVISIAAAVQIVRRLRDRLIECDSEHQYVETVRGHGFRLDNPLKN